jgi:ubiquitin carboxyl-terminal hydrolase L5
MEDPSGWSLTESDPQVFSELLRNLGVKGLQVVSARAEHEAEAEQLSPVSLCRQWAQALRLDDS